MVSEFLYWIFIIAISLFGITFVYFLGRCVIANIFPDIDEKFELYFILKDIKRYFGFLVEKGYKITAAEYSAKCNGNWTVQLESPDCIIYIVQDRSHIEVSLAPVLGIKSLKEWVALEHMIFLITQDQVCVSSFEDTLSWSKKRQFVRVAGLLKKYIEQISLFFAFSKCT